MQKEHQNSVPSGFFSTLTSATQAQPATEISSPTGSPEQGLQLLIASEGAHGARLHLSEA
jgi:hypothetical protein